MENELYINSFISSFLVLLFMINQSYAVSMIGKVLVYKNRNNQETYPLFDGDRIRQTNKYILRLTGATLVADSNTDVRVTNEYGVTVINISKGLIHFRVIPDKIRVSFRHSSG